MKQTGLAVKPLLTMAKHRRELLSKECVTMVASGFDQDPEFKIIYMPNQEEKEQEKEHNEEETPAEKE